jgi:hypothetical protein
VRHGFLLGSHSIRLRLSFEFEPHLLMNELSNVLRLRTAPLRGESQTLGRESSSLL